ncbi:TnsA endonuclease N-terminal domain-containing protein [Chromobacterium amazonense]|uniref:TnsA endonuclease N-terminal domain-containing protein n=1 Tax=Chromobacterium amazonense TaxID=1382803 RepID=UPI00237DF02F|nr:TnsA endonuclease N-terminal domain-containing protein [Chromobacterium amazonense]MDE1715501.1 TnsA endonuclease N-terminal domain-containing protein [Chromobacterium amazonense]
MNTIKDEALLARVTELLNSTRAVRDAFHIQGSSYRSWFPSRKGFDGPIPAESGLAADALRLLDLAPEIVMIVPEPFTLSYELDNEVRRYTPDFLLYLRDGRRAVIEVKWQKEADLPANKRRFEAIGAIFEAVGALFAVLTEVTLRAPVLRQNMSLVESQRHRSLPVNTIETILKCLSDGPVPLGELTAAVGDRRIVLAAVYQGIVALDLFKPMSANALARRA